MTQIDQAIAAFAKAQIEQRQRTTTRITELKRSLLAVLPALGIALIEVSFDGSGDSGAVEEIACRNAQDQDIELPEDAVVLIEDHGITLDEISLRNALEDLTYSALELHHPGWEDNDGAGGKLIVDVPAGTITLECQLRYIAIEECSSEL